MSSLLSILHNHSLLCIISPQVYHHVPSNLLQCNWIISEPFCITWTCYIPTCVQLKFLPRGNWERWQLYFINFENTGISYVHLITFFVIFEIECVFPFSFNKLKLGSFALRLVKSSHHVYVSLLLIKKQKQKIIYGTLLFIFFLNNFWINIGFWATAHLPLPCQWRGRWAVAQILILIPIFFLACGWPMLL